MFLLGDVFLRNFYSVYDYENLQVQLAVNKNTQYVGYITDFVGPSKINNFIMSSAILILTAVLYLIISHH